MLCLITKREIQFFLLIGSFLLLTGCLSSSPAPVAKLGLNSKNVSGTVLVKKQDTIWDIAKRFKLPLRDIILTNNMAAPYILTAGQRIKLPEPKEYRVRELDTLYSISRLFAVDVRRLVQLNNMQAPYSLRTGQILRLPANYVRPTRVAEYKKPYRPAPVKHQTHYKKPQQKTVKSNYKSPRKPVSAYKLTNHSHKSSNSEFIWPVRGKLLSGFGPKSGGLHNDGINIAVPRGTPVKSVSNGKVVYVGDDLGSFGNLVLIRHNGGWISAYGHLRDIKVSKGAQIKQGQALGTVGSSGSVTTPQLHFELRKGSKAINPQKYLL